MIQITPCSFKRQLCRITQRWAMVLLVPLFPMAVVSQTNIMDGMMGTNTMNNSNGLAGSTNCLTGTNMLADMGNTNLMLTMMGNASMMGGGMMDLMMTMMMSSNTMNGMDIGATNMMGSLLGMYGAGMMSGTDNVACTNDMGGMEGMSSGHGTNSTGGVMSTSQAVLPPTPMRLTVQHQMNRTTLSYPSSMTNYVLEVTETLGPMGRWVPWQAVSSTSGDHVIIPIDPHLGNRFYRLVPWNPITPTTNDPHAGHH